MGLFKEPDQKFLNSGLGGIRGFFFGGADMFDDLTLSEFFIYLAISAAIALSVWMLFCKPIALFWRLIVALAGHPEYLTF